MFFVYFPFVIILGIFVFKDSEKYNFSKWWAGLVGLAPITMPYYLFVTRGKKFLVPLVMFFALSGLVVMGEAFFYTKFKQRMQYAKYSPYAKQALEYTTQLKDNMVELNKFIINLDELGRVNSSLEKITETLKLVEAMTHALMKTITVAERFLILMNDYSPAINRGEILWLNHLALYYSDDSVIKYLSALQNYVNSFSALLKFTKENFENIHLKNSKQQKNYDHYYLKYIRSLERHNNIDINRMAFQKQLLQKYPDLKSYIPIISQTRFLSVWK